MRVCRDSLTALDLVALRRTGQLKGTRYWLPHGKVGGGDTPVEKGR